MSIRSKDGGLIWRRLANPRMLYWGIVEPATAYKAKIRRKRDTFERRIDRIIADAR